LTPRPEQTPEPSSATRKKPGSEKGDFGNSLFSPDADLKRRKKQ
jgi:hypothetical protein